MTTDQEVMGSTPIGRAILCIDLIYIREVAQLGRALGLGPRGRRFESCLPDFFYLAFCFQMIYNFFKLNMRP